MAKGKKTPKKKETTAMAKHTNANTDIEAYQGMFDMTKSLEGLIPRLPAIKLMHGEVQMFKMPDEEMVKDFEGLIVDFNRCNAYWKEPFETSGGGSPPDCSSMDSISVDMISDDIQTTNGKCDGCKQNVFGTARDGQGEGKACKNMMRLHILFDGQLIPFRMTIPATSLATMDEYGPLVASKGFPLPVMKTVFSLVQKVQKKGGAKFSKLALDMNDPIPVEEAAEVKKFIDTWKELMRGQPIVRGEGEDEAGDF